MTAQSAHVTPERIFEILNSYRNAAALKTAIELDVFTAIGEGADTTAALAKKCHAAERGMRILCDFLVILGLLTKQEQRYALSPDSAAFLNSKSPVCVASAVGFLALPELVDSFNHLTEAVQKGGCAMSDGEGTIGAENPIWVEFARSMGALQTFPAEGIAQFLEASKGEKWKVLDVAAGHGKFGIALARHNPNAEIFAQDWKNVLEVAKENARAAGVEKRYHALPGSAFDVDLGSGYNLILLTNFLHHYDPAAIETLLRKIHAALAPGGRAITLDFIPDEDRVNPAGTAAFAITMLASTPSGDAYTFSEYERMFRKAGFSSNELRPLPGGPFRVIVSHK